MDANLLLEDDGFRRAMLDVRAKADAYIAAWDGDLIGDFNVLEVASGSEPSELAEGVLRDLSRLRGADWVIYFRLCDTGYMRKWCSNDEWKALISSLELAKKIESRVSLTSQSSGAQENKVELKGGILKDEAFKNAMDDVRAKAKDYIVAWEGDLTGDFSILEVENEPSEIAESVLRGLSEQKGLEWLEIFQGCNVGYMRKWCSNMEWKALLSSIEAAKSAENAYVQMCAKKRKQGGRPSDPPKHLRREDPLYFYGHSKSKPYSCFSQFFPARFKINSIEYSCAEQYMMAEKARVMGDTESRNKILEAKTPRIMKQLGRKVTPFKPKTWDEVKKDVVFRGNQAKFSQNSELKKILLATGDRVIAEAAPNDKIWGIGLSVADASKGRPWRGQNLLGKALMRVRESLRKTS